MKSDISHLEKFRHTKPGAALSSNEGDRFGVFYIQNAASSFIILFDSGEDHGGNPGTGWERAEMRVAAHSGDRVPIYAEMDWLKGLFWDDDECAVQMHLPKHERRQAPPNTLYLWKEAGKEFPRPPAAATRINGAKR